MIINKPININMTAKNNYIKMLKNDEKKFYSRYFLQKKIQERAIYANGGCFPLILIFLNKNINKISKVKFLRVLQVYLCILPVHGVTAC